MGIKSPRRLGRPGRDCLPSDPCLHPDPPAACILPASGQAEARGAVRGWIAPIWTGRIGRARNLHRQQATLSRHGIISWPPKKPVGGELLNVGYAMTDLMRAMEAPANPEVPELRAGDTVNVHVRIKEGDKERIQEFRGTIIRTRKGGNQASFTVRRVAAHGIGVERTFALRSPNIERIVVQRRARVRRAQLYFLRGLRGKRARLRSKSEAHQE